MDSNSLLEIIKSGDVSLLIQAATPDTLKLQRVPGLYYVKNKTFSDPPLLHFTMLMQKVDMFHYFLVSEFDIDVLCNSWTPLHLASYLGLTNFVDILIFFGATIDIEDRYGLTPLMIAIQEHNTEIVKALLIAGAKVDENPAALHMAVREGVPEIVKQLLLFGANPNAKNRLGKSAFDIIRKPDPDEIEQMLHTVKAEQQCDPSKPRIAIVDQNITSLAELLDTLHVVGNACEEKPKFIVTKM